jgi:DNA-binding CsgD family transcriptional regulator
MKIEFYIDPIKPWETVVHDIENVRFRYIKSTDKALIESIIQSVKVKHPEAYDRLLKLHNSKYEMVIRFLRCNFALNDNRPDINDDFNFEFECVACPLKGGFCKDEGVICNPKVSSVLSIREIEVASYLADGVEKESVAELLFISVFTVENHRRNIYAKLGIHNKSELTKIAMNKGWIK